MGDSERFLISGATTAIGAWVAKLLIKQGAVVTALGDFSDDHRLRLIAEPSEMLALHKVDADIDDVESVQAAMEAATHVIHLDPVTDEDCDCDPRRAVTESVTRTAAVFEAARRCRVRGLAFESGMSVYPVPVSGGEVSISTPLGPTSLRGAFHHANELMAATFRSRYALSSVAVRPNLVYGPGVDRGRVSSTTTAIAAAIENRPYRVTHGGVVDFQFVADVAAAFIAAARVSAALADPAATAVNLSGQRDSVTGFLTTLGSLTGAVDLVAGEQPLTMPISANNGGVNGDRATTGLTRLDEGIRQTLETFRWAPRELYWHES